MSNVRWTDEQQKVIDSRGSNLLVAAAAGSGKTAVLIERIISMITDEKNPVDIDEILGVTFTNAAATEMKERISDAINKKLSEHPDDLRLKRQNILLSKAKISTIHSFCLDVIRSNFHRVNIDADFKTLEPEEMAILKEEAMVEAFEELYELNDEGFLKLVSMLSNKLNDDQAVSSLIKIYDKILAYPNPFEYLEKSLKSYEDIEKHGYKTSDVYKYFYKKIELSLAEVRDYLEKGLEEATYLNTDKKTHKMYEKILEFLDIVDRVVDSSTDDKPFEKMDEYKLPGLQGLRATKDGAGYFEQAKEYFNLARDEYNKTILLKQVIGEEFIMLSVKDSVVLMKSFIEIMTRFNSIYSDKKKQKSLIDYADMEHMTLDILTDLDKDSNFIPSEVAYEYRKNYKEVFVDEYQDINPVQEEILNAISDDEPFNRFMVGDIKQSIYGFRNADPTIFLEKYNSYMDVTKSEVKCEDFRGETKFEISPNKRKIILSKNFRSRKNILESTNYIFKRIMSEKSGELNYGPDEYLYPGANFKGVDQRSEVKIVTDNSEVTEEEVVANIIKELISGKSKVKIIDKGTGEFRLPEYKDIVILSRNVSSKISKITNELDKNNIPFFCDTGSGFFSTLEIRTMLSILKVIDNPDQDIDLLAALTSPIFDFTDDDIARIRVECPRVSIYQALLNIARPMTTSELGESVENKQESTELINATKIEKEGLTDSAKISNLENGVELDELKIKINSFLDTLKKWRESSKLSQIHELIWQILFTTGMYEYYGALTNGAQRQKNLMLIFDKARQFENTSLAGLYRFITYIERLKSIGSETGEAKILSENSNVVRYMSMHKSKGLEFPIVIIYATGTSFNLRDINNDIYLDDDGVVFKFLDEKRRIKLKTIFNRRAEEKYRKKILSEEMRTLYVAMTRAKEKLYITGKMKNFKKRYPEILTEEKNSRGVHINNPNLVLAKNSHLEWIISALCRHKDLEKLNREVVNAFDSEFSGFDFLDDESMWDVGVVKDNYEFLYTSRKHVTDVLLELYKGETEENPVTTDDVKRVISSDLYITSEMDKSNPDITDELKKKAEKERVATIAKIDEVKQLIKLNRKKKPWKYPYENIVNKPTSISVTEIKKIYERRNLFFDSEIEFGYDEIQRERKKEKKNNEIEASRIRELKKPSFVREKKSSLDAAKRGSIVHHLMQILDLDEVDTLEKINSQIEYLYANIILSQESKSVIDPKKVFKFFDSKIGRRALSSDYVGREREVLDNIDISVLYPEIGGSAEEFTMMRGIIDMFFEEDGELVVVDYKTDNMKGKTLKSIKEKYKLQLELYAKALEKITGKKVKEKWIYLYAIGKEVKID